MGLIALAVMGELSNEKARRSADVILEHARVVCFATEQIGVPIVQRLVVRNSGADPLPMAVLRLAIEPALSAPVALAVSALKPGEEHDFGVIDVPLEPGFLRRVLEAEAGRLVWQLLCEGSAIGGGQSAIEILAHNEWPGGRAPPALLATFVTPNHPAIGSLLQSVNQRLQGATGSNALDGYQAKSPARAYALVQALYDCVQSIGLSYACAPPSFEQGGQKVRLPDTLLRDRVGNCLDLTLFVVACLEQMGLAPLIILVKGHAIPAVWLLDDRFPEGVVADAARLRTAIALRYLVAFDSTTIVDAGHPPLEVARDAADRLLTNESDFEYAIDIRVARRDGFRPLSLREHADDPISVELSPSARIPRSVDVPPAVTSRAPRELDPIRDRFRLWRDQLLDLSLRNKLLNFRVDAKSSMPLEIPDIALFEDLLSSDKGFDVLPAAPRDNRDARDDVLQEKRSNPAQRAAELLADLRRQTIHSALQLDELLKRAVHMDRKARADLGDGGANTLYAAIGLLRWYESGEEDSARTAPLLLVPVQLEYQRTTRRIRVRRLQEDSVPNHTLVEKLKVDFAVDLSGLANVEPDESGLDVPMMLRSVRDAIRHIPRWEVEERSCLGLFTFTKFLMWRDLTANVESLLQSPVVRFLASKGTTDLSEGAAVIEPAALDEVPPEALPLVVDSDSSQTSAVISALAGRSFILQGPPGTGKSQTITNLIAAALHDGKTVLFVSEKMAALEVVHRRLTQVGLADFCLELHSHKAQKRNVILSAKAALERRRSLAKSPWIERSRDLGLLRRELNLYVEALHRPHAIGMSFFEVTSRILHLRDAPQYRLSLSNVVDMSDAQYRSLRELAGRLATSAAATEPIREHPWSSSGLRAWSSVLEESLRDSVREALNQLRALRTRAAAFCEALAIPVAGYSVERLERLAEAVRGLASGPLPQALMDAQAWHAVVTRTDRWRGAAAKAQDSRRDLAARWSESLFEIDLDPLCTSFQKWGHSFFLFAWFFLRSARSSMRQLARAHLPPNRQIAEDLKQAQIILNDRAALDAERIALVQLFQGTWDGVDVQRLETLLVHGAQVRDQLQRLCRAMPVPPVALMLPHPATADAKRKHARFLADDLMEALHGCRVTTEAATQALKLPQELLPADSPQYIDEIEQLLERFLDALPRLRAWCLYARLFDEACKSSLDPIAGAHAAGTLPAKDIELAVERSLLEGWAMAVRDRDPPLRDFDGPNRHRLVERFREQDRRHLELARRKVVEALEGRYPVVGERTSEKSELGVLRREAEKKTRHLPIRKLFQQLPNVLPRLKPCLLMSPLSVAQYLPPDGKRFDLVIFDEASQICTYDAVGAIARGNQVVVVGDSKQLPPTSFFKRGTDDDAADENDFEELESVLDEAKAAGLPEQMLTWHYRSRHEALITFSNDHFYAGRLNVFPAAASRVPDLGVHLHPVRDGVYERSRSRSNPIEAKTLVDFLVKRLEAVKPGQRTFGIVTLSQAQQDTVEDLLDQARGANSQIEGHFSEALSEPVFVKNLENVQGDERDEIFFSVGYGPDETGRVAMNFGPLNRKGGERRLNVAVTRARRVLRVFSTLTPDHIDLRRTVAVGPRHLKDFLTYAARNGAREDAGMEACAFESAFEEDLAGHIIRSGHRVDSNVGSGAYKLGLALAHPERPGVYALAVEGDGRAYASAATACDRDRLRHDVLAGENGLGWSLHRVWSTDWWFDRAGEIRRLDEAIARAFAEQPAQGPVYEPAPEEVEDAPPSDVGPPTKAIGRATPGQSDGSPQIALSEKPIASPMTPYRRAELQQGAADPETLFDEIYGQPIHRAIAEVVDVEAPLHVDDMCRRVGAAFGVSRLSQRMRTRILHVAAGCLEADIRGDFVWSRRTPCFEGMRGPSEDGEVRQAERLPPEEVANVARWILSENVALPRDALLRAMAHSFGLRIAGNGVQERMREGLRSLEAGGGCTVDGDTVAYREAREDAAAIRRVQAVAGAGATEPSPSVPTTRADRAVQSLTAALGRSVLFAERCRPDARDQVLRAVEMLSQRHGHRAPIAALATALGCHPARGGGLIAMISETLNHDGFVVLRREASHVSLDVETLRELYALDTRES